MDLKRPHLSMAAASGTSTLVPKAIKQTSKSADTHQVPEGLDSRGFALHRIFCMAGDLRCPACLAKFGINTPAAEPVKETLYSRVVKIMPPLGAQVHPDARGKGVYFSTLHPEGNAAKAGIIEGDSVLAVNGVFIKMLDHKSALGLLAGTDQLSILISSTRDPASIEPLPSHNIGGNNDPISKVLSLDTKTDVPHAESAAPPQSAKPESIVINREPGVPLGLQIMPANPDGLGIRVNMVVAGGSAAAAGVVEGNVICAVNGVDISTLTHDEAKLALAGAGDKIVLDLAETLPSSDDTPMDTETDSKQEVELMATVTLPLEVEPHQKLGVAIVPVTREPIMKGMRIHIVDIDGVAAAAGLMTGDEVLYIDSFHVENVTTGVAVEHLKGLRIRNIVVSRPQCVFRL